MAVVRTVKYWGQEYRFDQKHRLGEFGIGTRIRVLAADDSCVGEFDLIPGTPPNDWIAVTDPKSADEALTVELANSFAPEVKAGAVKLT